MPLFLLTPLWMIRPPVLGRLPVIAQILDIIFEVKEIPCRRIAGNSRQKRAII